MGDALVRTQRSGDSVVVEVRGALEADTVGAMRSVLLDTIASWKPKRLTVDLRNVPFMDSVGIGTLVAGSNATRDAGGTFEVRNPSPFVHRLLHITGLTELFGLRPLKADEAKNASTLLRRGADTASAAVSASARPATATKASDHSVDKDG
jgi:anti-sigma B factor antagonist